MVFASVLALTLAAAGAALIADLAMGLYGAIAVVAVVGIAGAWWVSARVGAPLEALLEWSRRPSARGPRVASRDEWKDLAETFSGLLSSANERAERAESERAHLQAVMDTMADGVLVVDRAARVQMVNRAARGLFEECGPDSSGRTVIECTMSAPLDAAIHRALDSGATHYTDIELLFPNPRQIRAVVSAAGEGPSQAAVAVLHDITDRVHLERVRKDFVANVSHELRTPVSGIQTMAENLLDGALDDPTVARHFLKHILDSTRRLVALLGDLLVLARAESGQPLSFEAVDVSSIASEVANELEHLREAKDIRILVTVPHMLRAFATPEAVRQIITNLVENAVKYSPSGGAVEVSGRESGGFVEVRVTDHGIGIPPEHQTRIFERFYRVDRARSRELGGTGLGLSIVKHLAETAGGGVEVDSTPGRGSVFTVRLPVAPQ
jgi:two-component system phosphate regulon sensor histidine kinase PhoR